MINKKKHPKIFYVPGMISLVLLPLFCLLFFYENRSFSKDYSFQLMIADTLFHEKPNKNYIGFDFYLPKRNFKTIFFNGSKEFDDIKLKNTRSEINQMYKIEDSINGIKFVFGKHTTYETFINTLDVLTVDDVRYIPFKNEVYAFYLPPVKHKKKLIKFEAISYCQVYVDNEDYLKIKLCKEREFLITAFKEKWQIFVAYFGIVFLNIFALVKFNNNRKFK